MKPSRLFIWTLPLLLAACAPSISGKGTIAELHHRKIEIKAQRIEGGLEKAMRGYQRFLEETPDSALTPEAIRRLADLKIEKEYGVLTGAAASLGQTPERPAPPSPAIKTTHPPPSAAGAPPQSFEVRRPSAPGPEGMGARSQEKKKGALPAPERASITAAAPDELPRTPSSLTGEGRRGGESESEAEFESRTTRRRPVPTRTEVAGSPAGAADDLDRADTREAIALYTKLLTQYPFYQRNDQVLYQMSRAYEELGEIEEAMKVMNRMVRDYPHSRYIDEVQFRRAEYFFAHRRWLDAEDAYGRIVAIGIGSYYYELALYKLGWTFYKQELYEEALNRFVKLMDHKVSQGYDFNQTEDEQERKRTEDTFRVVSLGFSNLGGAESVLDYFSRHGPRPYEDSVYRNLGEFYFDKRRYADASATYNAFVRRNPFHKMAPNFQMRVIEIHAAGGFPSLVLESKKKFASTYGLKAEYWKHFQPSARPDVLGFLKTNLMDLAKYYHAGYQDSHQTEKKAENLKEALHWYREFLASFPLDAASPAVNFQLADLLMEDRAFRAAAVEYEKTAYGYPPHAKSSQAGYAAVYAYREQLNVAAPEHKDAVKREAVRSSLQFADTFPHHEKAAIVLGAAADDLYEMKDYTQSLSAAQKLLDRFPGADIDIIRSAWLVVGHSSYELMCYHEAESAYQNVLALLPADDKTHDALVDNLAASIYKQGEQASSAGDYRQAAEHFLRVGRAAPTSKIRPTAEYDGAAALIQLKDWKAAATVLLGYRRNFPGHALQPEVTKKIAYVYREDGRFALAADEYERIERESKDDEVRRDALLTAAELHAKTGNNLRALAVYRRYVDYFAEPLEINLETRNKIAEILKAQDDRQAYLHELEEIVAIDASAGSARTPRTRYLAAKGALVLDEEKFKAFTAVRLIKPFEQNLLRKRELMETAVQGFNGLMDYEIGEFTAAATFYLAEIYADFSKALTTSERPQGLSASEREQYELAIEEQAYPFEEKAIKVHESNLQLISRGVYNGWIEKSLQKLAAFVPVRYDKPEEQSGIVGSQETYIFVIDWTTTTALPETESAEPAQAESKPAAEPVAEGTAAVDMVESDAGSEQGAAVHVLTPDSFTKLGNDVPEPEAAPETENVE